MPIQGYILYGNERWDRFMPPIPLVCIPADSLSARLQNKRSNRRESIPSLANEYRKLQEDTVSDSRGERDVEKQHSERII